MKYGWCMKKDEAVYLRHILDAISTIADYLLDVDEGRFKSVKLIQDGTIRQIEIIGEAVRHVSSEVRNDHPEVPWEDIAGMRDKLIHGYFGVDLEKVWLTVLEDLPVLQKQVVQILAEVESRET